MIRGLVGADGSAAFDGKELPRTGVHAAVEGRVEGGVDVAKLYEAEGERCFETLGGSFAIAIFDARDAGDPKLTLARDAFGTKAIYSANDHGRFLFATEPAAILAAMKERPHVDPLSIDDVLAFGWTERRRTGYEEIERLEPGAIAVHRKGRLERRAQRTAPSSTPRPGDALVRELERSVRASLESGTPPVVLFSLDAGSVALVETLARIAREPVRTYSAVLEGLEGEPSTARAAAERFGAHHRQVSIAAKDLPQIAEDTLASLDEPLADPDLLLLRAACKDVREETGACFSADGGGAVLGSVERYAWMRTEGSRSRPPMALVPIYRTLVEALPFVGATRLRSSLRTRIDVEERRYVSTLVATESIVRKKLFAKGLRRSAHRQNESERELWNDFGIAGDLDARMRGHDLRHVVPNRILARTRHAAAPFGLEVRFPYLDPAVLAEAGSIPTTTGASEESPSARKIAPALAPLIDGYLVGSRLAADGWLSETTLASVVRAHRRGPGFQQTVFARTVFALLALEIWYRKQILRYP